MITQNIIADKMVFGGDCIAKIEGKTVFIPYAIPGEELKIEITDEKRDYAHAKILEVVKASPHRINPICPLYTKCGGCNMQHIDYNFQQKLRVNILKDAFKRENIELTDVEIIAGNSLGYRSRFQFHNGGLMQRMSNNILSVNNCPVAVKEINEWLNKTPQEKRPTGRVHIFGSEKIVEPSGQKVIAAIETQRLVTGKEQEKAKIKGKRKIKQRFAGTVQNPHNNCTIELLGKKITFDVQGFFQSNLEVLEKTISAVTEGLGGKNVLDMYAGAGTFSVFLADLFENVTLVEHNRDALVYAEQNLSGKKHESFGVSGEKWVLEHAASCIKRNGPFDAVVIDPPRLGMEKAVCQWLCQSGIKTIHSVSCDIATHARDAKFLLRAGYKIKKIALLDFYPQTGHIESLCVFEK